MDQAARERALAAGFSDDELPPADEDFVSFEELQGGRPKGKQFMYSLSPEQKRSAQAAGFSEADMPKVLSPAMQSLLGDEPKESPYSHIIYPFASALTFDMADDIVANLGAAAGYPAHLLGIIPEGFREQRQAISENLNEKERLFGEQHPRLDLPARIGGALTKNPLKAARMVLPGVSAKVAAAIEPLSGTTGAAIKALSRGASNIGGKLGKGVDYIYGQGKGFGDFMARNVGQAITEGGLTGLFSEGDEGALERVARGGSEAGIAAIPLSALMRGGGRAVAALGAKVLPTWAEKGVTPAEKLLSKYAEDIPTEKIDPGLAAMVKAEEEGVPLFPAEALQSATLSRLARRVLGNAETREQALDILKQRGIEAPERIRKNLGAIAPETSPYAAGTGLKKGGLGVEAALEEQREKAVEKLYPAAYGDTPVIEGPEYIDDFLDTDIAQRAIKYARKNIRGMKGRPDNDIELVQYARDALWGERNKLLEQGAKKISAEHGRHYHDIGEELLEVAPKLKKADVKFTQKTKPLTEFYETPIGSLLQTDANPDKYLDTLIESSPEAAARMRAIFKKQLKEEGEQTIRSGVRGALERDILKSRDPELALIQSQSLPLRMLGAPGKQQTMRTLLGEETFDPLREKLLREQDIHKYTRDYGVGSTTVENAQDQARLLQRLKNIYQLAQGNVLGGIDLAKDLLPGAPSRETMKGVRELLIPGTEGERYLSRTSIANILPFLQAQRQRTQQADAIARRLATLFTNPIVTSGIEAADRAAEEGY